MLNWIFKDSKLTLRQICLDSKLSTSKKIQKIETYLVNGGDINLLIPIFPLVTFWFLSHAVPSQISPWYNTYSIKGRKLSAMVLAPFIQLLSLIIRRW